ncbi:MAG: MraY family glycosyltransferase, partial [Actinomycetota bacterium]
MTLGAGAGFVATSGVPQRLVFLLLGGLVLLGIGLIDDHPNKSMSPYTRLVFQLVVASVGWMAGFRADTPGVFGGIGTILFLVAAMNAFNLLDNMDGVAGSTAFAASAGIAVIAIMGGQTQVAALSAAVAGACLGFLFFNFRRAKVYMGNGGSLFLGFLIGGAALKLRPDLPTGWGEMAIVLLLAVPAADTSVVILSRLLFGRKVFQGGTDHISHRLVRLGMRSWQAALIHGGAMAMAAASVATAIATGRRELMLAAAASIVLASVFLLTVRVYQVGGRTLPARRIMVAAGAVAGGAILLAAPSALSARGDLINARVEIRSGKAALSTFEI